MLVPLVAGALLLASFITWALRRHRRVTPLVDLRLFRVRSFTWAASLMFISGLSMYGALLLLPLYYQQVRGASALGAGLLMAPQGIGALLPRTLAGKLTDRIGPRPVVLAGMAVAAAGTVPFALAVGGSFGTAVLAVILVGHSFQATFWWSVAFTALAVLPAVMLPRRAAAREQSRRTSRAAEPEAPGG